MDRRSELDAVVDIECGPSKRYDTGIAVVAMICVVLSVVWMLEDGKQLARLECTATQCEVWRGHTFAVSAERVDVAEIERAHLRPGTTRVPTVLSLQRTNGAALELVSGEQARSVAPAILAFFEGDRTGTLVVHGVRWPPELIALLALLFGTMSTGLYLVQRKLRTHIRYVTSVDRNARQIRVMTHALGRAPQTARFSFDEVQGCELEHEGSGSASRLVLLVPDGPVPLSVFTTSADLPRSNLRAAITEALQHERARS